MGRPEAPMDKPLLAVVLCRHPLQRYAATSDEALHSYPATHFGRKPATQYNPIPPLESKRS
jgi:hypothetical protein